MNSYDLIKHIERQRTFSLHTFGPGHRTQGVCDHIRKELLEIEKAPLDLEEWVDVILLGLDGAWRTGHNATAIVEAIEAKLTKNEQRQWPDWRTADQTKAIEHVRTPQACAACDRGDYQIGHHHLCPKAEPLSLLEWDEEWGGMKYPEKSGYMRGDRSTTLWLITREVHDSSCTLSGVFRADADEQNGILFDEAGAKDTAERLTRQWLEKHSKLLTAQA